ncbi:MAG: hypothetical protein HRT47_11230 [Candidatus Caenarcaniphilales bacterium]|nr:hypothetical protein [Candidatus Caenarcaniphilales bacterium]
MDKGDLSLTIGSGLAGLSVLANTVAPNYLQYKDVSPSLAKTCQDQVKQEIRETRKENELMAKYYPGGEFQRAPDINKMYPTGCPKPDENGAMLVKASGTGLGVAGGYLIAEGVKDKSS